MISQIPPRGIVCSVEQAVNWNEQCEVQNQAALHNEAHYV